jgi:hypothetical protein
VHRLLMLLVEPLRPLVPAAATARCHTPAVLLLLAAALLALAADASSAPTTCQPVDMAAVPGAEQGQLSQPGATHRTDIPFTNNTNAGCAGPEYKDKPCPFVDNAVECRAACVAHAGCSAWSVFWGCNTGPKTGPLKGRTKHSCLLLNLTAQTNDGDGHYVSGMLKPLPPADVWPDAGGGPPKGCTGNYSSFSFCDTSLPPEQRAKLLSEMLTLKELSDMMNDEQPPVDRLGIQPYRYGHEGLHGTVANCIVAGKWRSGGRCFTDFPTSSAAVASFNRR